jgi:cytoskeletal protein RodZ
MDEDDKTTAASQRPQGIGARMRAAREAKGLSLEQVAAETRIPQRHLMAIEAGDFAKLPARTYAVGFSRTYAKTLGLDQDEAVAEVRAEFDTQGDDDYRPASFEPGDPARVPSRALGWFAAFAVLLLLAGVFFFFRTMFAPAGELPSLIEPQKTAVPTPRPTAGVAPTPTAATAGPVTFTALVQGIWVKFYDADGKQLMQKQMDKGETFTVPADAKGPMLWTGRPDALAIAIGGKPVPKLAEEQTVMKDVPVTAEALLSRSPASQPSVSAPAGENPVRSAT